MEVKDLGTAETSFHPLWNISHYPVQLFFPSLAARNAAAYVPVTMATIAKILAPTDFSEDSNNAMVYAEDIARKFGAELILLHVAQALAPVSFGLEPGITPDPLALETIGRIAEEQRLAAQRELDRMVNRLRESGLKARSMLRVG